MFTRAKHARSDAHIVPALSWLIPVPFYFMELLVGFVQALVFMLLTAVFTLVDRATRTGRQARIIKQFRRYDRGSRGGR